MGLSDSEADCIPKKTYIY